jgi:sulfhydrogenase subunit beta (sulfur reductase)
MIKVANHDELIQLLNKLGQEFRLAAPVVKKKGRQEKVEYDYIDDPGQIYLEQLPNNPVKEFFLPQNEKLAPEEMKQTILFGVRPCDLAAIKVLDDVFLDDGNSIDSYYQRHRDHVIIFGLSCSERKPTCFCDAVGIDQIESEGAPIFVFRIEDKYYFKIYDQNFAYLLEDLPEADEKELERVIAEKRASLKKGDFTLDLPVPLPEATTFTAPVWENIAEKCLGCGVCTYYCPTCYCFGFYWEDNEKYRNWDSCMFSNFTKHASGHNPRTTQEQRYRQRIMHKYSYHPNNYEGLACTGCGRCIDNCPVNLDIRKALKSIESYLKEEGGVKNG